MRTPHQDQPPDVVDVHTPVRHRPVRSAGVSTCSPAAPQQRGSAEFGWTSAGTVHQKHVSTLCFVPLKRRGIFLKRQRGQCLDDKGRTQMVSIIFKVRTGTKRENKRGSGDEQRLYGLQARGQTGGEGRGGAGRGRDSVPSLCFRSDEAILQRVTGNGVALRLFFPSFPLRSTSESHRPAQHLQLPQETNTIIMSCIQARSFWETNEDLLFQSLLCFSR